MDQVVCVKSKNLFPLINEIINHEGKAKITVTGMSMYPFLRENIDSVELEQASFSNIKTGDIVLILRNNGQYIMHRIVKKESSCFYIVGDAQQSVEGPLDTNQLVAIIVAVWRRDKRIECTNFWWRLLSKCWIILVPFRHIILRITKHLCHIYRYFILGGALYEKKQ